MYVVMGPKLWVSKNMFFTEPTWWIEPTLFDFHKGLFMNYHLVI